MIGSRNYTFRTLSLDFACCTWSSQDCNPAASSHNQSHQHSSQLTSSKLGPFIPRTGPGEVLILQDLLGEGTLQHQYHGFGIFSQNRFSSLQHLQRPTEVAFPLLNPCDAFRCLIKQDGNVLISQDRANEGKLRAVL